MKKYQESYLQVSSETWQGKEEIQVTYCLLSRKHDSIMLTQYQGQIGSQQLKNLFDQYYIIDLTELHCFVSLRLQRFFEGRHSINLSISYANQVKILHLFIFGCL